MLSAATINLPDVEKVQANMYNSLFTYQVNGNEMKKVILSILLIVFATFGCASDNEKPSADSLLTTEAFSIINSIREAYEEKNASGLNKHAGSLLAGNIIKELTFEKVDLLFTPRMVRITDEAVKVNLTWKGTWSFPENRNLENRGVADLVLHRETMKLTFIEGDNPFIAPSYRESFN